MSGKDGVGGAQVLDSPKKAVEVSRRRAGWSVVSNVQCGSSVLKSLRDSQIEPWVCGQVFVWSKFLG